MICGIIVKYFFKRAKSFIKIIFGYFLTEFISFNSTRHLKAVQTPDISSAIFFSSGTEIYQELIGRKR